MDIEFARIRQIDGNRIFFYGGGVVGYRWISNNNIVVNIQYTNLSGPKPEPLEVVRAYLVKYPSSITLTDAEVRTRAHNEQWLKDEMERRVWLSEKWMPLVEDGKGDMYQELMEVHKHLKTFLAYRKKYMGVDEKADMEAIDKALLSKEAGVMGRKVREMRAWWNENKTKPLQNVPGN